MKKTFSINGIIILLFAISLAACNSHDSVKEANQANEQKSDSAVAAPTINEGDAKFMTEAADGGLMEVELGKVAQQNGHNERVKNFGAMMVREHSKAGDELKSLATTKNVTLPASLSNHHQQMVDDMQKKTGSDFDKAYINMMVNDHTEDAEAFRKEANGGVDSDTRGFASRTLTMVETHLDSAKAIEKALTGK